MTARVRTAGAAVSRLADLGLSIDLLERVVRRAGGLASPGSAGDGGIVVEVSRL